MNKKLFSLLGMIAVLIAVFMFKGKLDTSVEKKKTILQKPKKYSPVVVTEDKIINPPNRSVSYSLRNKKCQLAWQVDLYHKEGQENLGLRLRVRECSLDFKDQLGMHSLIFERIFQDWDRKKFKGFSTPGLRSLNPSFSWNTKVIEAGLSSKDLIDYKKNYPNHASKKSINGIFVELTNATDAYAPLKAFFYSIGFVAKLNSCEKVFQMDAKAAKKRGVDLKNFKSIIYDAGALYFQLNGLKSEEAQQ